MSYVETHLKEAGKAFLPQLQWCPWGSQVLKELKIVMEDEDEDDNDSLSDDDNDNDIMAVDFLVTSSFQNISDT